MSDHVIVTIAVPAAHIADANELARCLGYSAADGESFGTAAWQDGEGHLYAVASGPVRPTFVSASASPLAAPAWGADMAAAARAQALVAIHEPEAGEPPCAAPDRIAAVAGLAASAALAVLGLSPVPADADA